MMNDEADDNEEEEHILVEYLGPTNKIMKRNQNNECYFPTNFLKIMKI